MSSVLIVYYSRTGNTEKMANAIEKAIKDDGINVVKKKVEEIHVDELLKYDGIIIGTPCYYGTMAWQIKKFHDESVKFLGKLSGKVGAAFTSSANIGGGNETAILSILEALLIHGMVVQGEPRGDHYGPVAINAPDKRALECCERMAKNVAKLVKKLSVKN